MGSTVVATKGNKLRRVKPRNCNDPDDKHAVHKKHHKHHHSHHVHHPHHEHHHQHHCDHGDSACESQCSTSPAELNHSEIMQELFQGTDTSQGIFQVVIIKDSEAVEVTLANLQAVISLQLALQLAIALVVSVSVASATATERITQDLIQSVYSRQSNISTVVIEGSRNITVTEVGAEIALNIQILLQVLVALLAKVEVA